MPALFEQDMLQLFANARQWYGVGTEGYGEMTTLQRLYNEITPSRERLTDAAGTRHIKSRASDVDVVTAQHSKALAPQRFASGPYGPGSEPPYAPPERLREVPHAAYKGRVLHVGDWVHLMNPVDPARPIVAQIFRLYKRYDVPGTFLSACWYYRPEQTHHAESHEFAPSEVVQTNVFAEHALEDVLEPVLVLFHTVYERARPSAPFWDVDMPTYVVACKYDVNRHAFFAIESWASCVPSSVRDKETYVVQRGG